MKKTLVIITGQHKGKRISLLKEVLRVGRDPQADIRINSIEVSRNHCEIHLRGEQVVIKDLGSRNGTFLNGEAIFNESLMKPGDTLHIGAVVFELAGKKAEISPPKSKLRKPPGARVAQSTASEAEVVDWLVDENSFTDGDTPIMPSSGHLKKQTEHTHLKAQSSAESSQTSAPSS